MPNLAASTGQGYVAGMGRTPTKKDTSVNVRLTSGEREALERLAARNRRTLSDYIRIILQDHGEYAIEPFTTSNALAQLRLPLLARTAVPAAPPCVRCRGWS
jgi:hypothetical protein